MHRSSVHDVGLLASDETLLLESKRLELNGSTGIISGDADIILFLSNGTI